MTTFSHTSRPPGPPALPGPLQPGALPCLPQAAAEGGGAPRPSLLTPGWHHSSGGSSSTPSRSACSSSSAEGAASQAQLEDTWESQKYISFPQNSWFINIASPVTCILEKTSFRMSKSFCMENKKCSLTLSIRARLMQVTKMLMQEGFSFVGLNCLFFFFFV